MRFTAVTASCLAVLISSCIATAAGQTTTNLTLADLAATVDALKSDLLLTQTQLKTTQQTVTQLTATVVQLQTRVATLESQPVSAVTTRVDALNATINGLTNLVGNISTTVKANTGKLSALPDDLSKFAFKDADVSFSSVTVGNVKIWSQGPGYLRFEDKVVGLWNEFIFQPGVPDAIRMMNRGGQVQNEFRGIQAGSGDDIRAAPIAYQYADVLFNSITLGNIRIWSNRDGSLRFQHVNNKWNEFVFDHPNDSLRMMNRGSNLDFQYRAIQAGNGNHIFDLPVAFQGTDVSFSSALFGTVKVYSQGPGFLRFVDQQTKQWNEFVFQEGVPDAIRMMNRGGKTQLEFRAIQAGSGDDIRAAPLAYQYDDATFNRVKLGNVTLWQNVDGLLRFEHTNKKWTEFVFNHPADAIRMMNRGTATLDFQYRAVQAGNGNHILDLPIAFQGSDPSFASVTFGTVRMWSQTPNYLRFQDTTTTLWNEFVFQAGNPDAIRMMNRGSNDYYQYRAIQGCYQNHLVCAAP